MMRVFPERMEVWPGPMEGVMGEAFVRAASELGLVDCWMTPFLRVTTGVPHRRRLLEFLEPFLHSNIPVTVQLMGTAPDVVAAMAVEIVRLGACAINLNFGCPSRRVVSGGAGGGALRNPEGMARMICAVRSALPEDVPLTVKMRSGFASPREMPEVLESIVGTCAVSQIFLHFRTVQEQYSPVPDGVERLTRAVELARPVPVIANGDIATIEDARRILQQTGAAGVMCARGWLRDPALLGRLRGETWPEPEVMRRCFFAAVVKYGLRRGQAIELSNFLWGAANPWFEVLRKWPENEIFDLNSAGNGGTFHL